MLATRVTKCETYPRMRAPSGARRRCSCMMSRSPTQELTDQLWQPHKVQNRHDLVFRHQAVHVCVCQPEVHDQENLQTLRGRSETVGHHDERVASFVTSPLPTEREKEPSQCSAPVAIRRQLLDSTEKLEELRESAGEKTRCSAPGLHWNTSLSRLRNNLRDDPARERTRFHRERERISAISFGTSTVSFGKVGGSIGSSSVDDSSVPLARSSEKFSHRHSCNLLLKNPCPRHRS